MHRFACRLISSFIVIICLVLLISQFIQCHRFTERANASPTHELNLSDLGNRVLIISPHPDDEVLACGGLIALLAENGASIRVLFITLGEGFTFALEHKLRTIFVSVKDRLCFARLRCKEANEALKILDRRGNLEALFLGIPESAMGQMWLNSWGLSNPCRTNAIKSSRSFPLTKGINPTLLCADEAIEQLKYLIKEFKPTSIFIPHGHDDHIVHWVTNVLSLAAMLELVNEGNLSNNAPVYGYLVHFGRYPMPQGKFPKLPLLPPNMLSRNSDAIWVTLPLPQDIVSLKAKAIRAYESQHSVMPRFMNSFIRSTETFERLELGEHLKSPIFINDRLFEPAMPSIYPSADIKSADISCYGDLLYITINLRSHVGEQITYRLHMFKPGCDDGIRYHILVSVRGNHIGAIGIPSHHIQCQRAKNSITIALPKNSLMGFKDWLITIEVVAGRRMVERTAPIIASFEGDGTGNFGASQSNHHILPIDMLTVNAEINETR